MIHYFPTESIPAPGGEFTDPFRYFPDPLVKYAADLLMHDIKCSEELHEAFSEGKMLGVLVVTDQMGRTGYLAGFSGNAGGRSNIDGFVPPVYDLLDPSGHFRMREAEISGLNRQIRILEDSEELSMLEDEINGLRRMMEDEISLQKARMEILKRQRDEIRREEADSNGYPELIRQSQHEKAELKRIRTRWEERIREVQERADSFRKDIKELKNKRAGMSDELQKWIFTRYIVHNICGEEKTIWEIFTEQGIVPPGGTGECAAPKLLEHAFRNNLKPVAMGEFWYGTSPVTAVRTEGHFYPSCTSKCGPLLRFMLKGMKIHIEGPIEDVPEIIYDDDSITVIEKPSGIPSVPGLDGRLSAYDILKETYSGLETVHRLDMDTSGILIFAKSRKAAADLQSQFESHTIRKTYIARLSYAGEGKELKKDDTGHIDLPLSPDYDERPRQKADITDGKPAKTAYAVTSVNKDGSIDVTFNPLNGRTHQLRVHSAHILGLGHPIVGDLLYGGAPAERLMLHAQSITFLHPETKAELTLTSGKHPFPEI